MENKAYRIIGYFVFLLLQSKLCFSTDYSIRIARCDLSVPVLVTVIL